MSKTRKITITAILAAIAMILPFSPLKMLIPPAMTVTVASHVPVWIAMFISPYTVVAVVVMQSAGYLMAGLPIDVFFRSLSHLIFALLGSIYIMKIGRPKKFVSNTIFCFILSIIHALAEVAVITFIFFPSPEYIAEKQPAFASPIMYIWIAVGLGAFIHGIVDYILASLILGGTRSVSTNKQQSE